MNDDEVFEESVNVGQVNAHVVEYLRYLKQVRQTSIEEFRSSLIKSIDKEEITPLEAETIVAASNLLPFEGQHWPATMDDSHWPLAFAVLWISWRDPALMSGQWDRFRTWAGHLWRDPRNDAQIESLWDAEDQLWKALEAGSVNAVGLPHQETDYSEIPSIQWRNLIWMAGFSKISVRNFAQTEARYRCVDVKRADMLAIWPVPGKHSPAAVEETKQPEDTQPRKRDKGGATAQYDEIDFMIEAFRILYEDVRSPTSQADLNRRATDAYATAKGLPAGKPSIEWGRENIRRIWVGLGLERPKRPQ